MIALETIVEELKCLSPEKLDEAAALIHALKEDSGLSDEWKREIECRSNEIREGKVECMLVEETFAYMKQKLENGNKRAS